MPSLTLLEAAKAVTGNPLKKAVIKKFAEQSDLLRVLPFEDVAGPAKEIHREVTLPTTAFRALNGSWGASHGKTGKILEPTVIAGGTIEIDRQLEKRVPGSRASQELMKVKALAHDVGHKAVKGDAQSTNTEFDGLQVRCTGSQLIANGSTSGGDVLALGKIDELLDKVPGANALVMSRAMRRILTTAIRAGIDSPITYDKDEFGRRISMYADLPILLTDGPDMVYTTLAFNEANPGGGSAVGQSIYALRIALDGFHGIQNGGMEVADLGQISATKLTTLVDWSMGLVAETDYCIGRLYGIKDGAATR